MKSTVALKHLDSYGESEIEQGLADTLASLGGIEALIPSATNKVLIKPNLINADPWHKGVTVNLTLIAKLAQMIKAAGLDVVIGEGHGFDQFCAGTLDKLGATKMAREIGVPIYDFKTGERIKVKIPGGKRIKEVTVDKIVTECDFIISLAKLKTHCETFVSLSMKNMKGLLCIDRERLLFHLRGINECLVDYNRAFKPDLAIVEGLIGMEGIGPLCPPGKPIDLGLIIAGKDPVAVDAVCSKIMHFNPADIRHLKQAAEAGMGTINMDEIEILGEKMENVTPKQFAQPPSSIEGLSPYNMIHIVNGKPCSNCMASLASYLHAYMPKKWAEEAISEIQILLGAKAKAKGTGKEIALGDCLKRYDGKIPFIPGCPPPADAYEALIRDGLKGRFIVPEATIPTAIDRFFDESDWVTTVE
jgi:uncharacterized protein (DUF362 family)